MDCLTGPKHRDWIACHWGPMPPPLTLTLPWIVHSSCSRQSLRLLLTLKAIGAVVVAVVAAAVVEMMVGHQTFPELEEAAVETDCQTFPAMEAAAVVDPRTSFPNSTVAVAVAGLHTTSLAVVAAEAAVAAVATSSSYQGHS